jgi:DNA-directed RNA polymerase specialized sigma24 family protein
MTAACFHEQFVAFLPKIKEAARFAFRTRNPADREEAVADVCAAAWSAWRGLIRRGKNPLEVGPFGILTNAIRYVRKGRRVGNPSSGRGRMDLWHRKAQRRGGFKLVSLAAARQDGDLKAWVANDHKSTPADHAAFLIDFEDWLSRLPERRRLSAELLSRGFGTNEVARQVGLTPAAITQARAALARNWSDFQQQDPTA